MTAAVAQYSVSQARSWMGAECKPQSSDADVGCSPVTTPTSFSSGESFHSDILISGSAPPGGPHDEADKPCLTCGIQPELVLGETPGHASAAAQATASQDPVSEVTNAMSKVEITSGSPKAEADDSKSPIFTYTPRPRRHSTSSVVVTGGTISYPDAHKMLTAVATMLECQMTMTKNQKPKSGSDEKRPVVQLQTAESEFLVFSESHHTRAEPCVEVPTVSEIYKFIRKMFVAANFSDQCALILLVYINRLIGVTGMPLTPDNWRPVTVTALLLAQKVVEDNSICNSDFPLLYNKLTLKEINLLEKRFVALLDFKLHVPPSLYAQYFFELRDIVFHPDIDLMETRRSEPIAGRHVYSPWALIDILHSSITPKPFIIS